MEKEIKRYTEIYRDSLRANGFSDLEWRCEAYRKRLSEMYSSEAFIQHNIYPTMDVIKIYAVIAMCLELKEEGLPEADIITIINAGFDRIRKKFSIILKLVDALPNSYKIAERWNINDHAKRVKDGSITYDVFDVSDGKIEYSISKCMYVEMFSYYGIRSLCKIFCITDEYAYSRLTKRVKFIRHSDLSEGECCHDEIIRK